MPTDFSKIVYDDEAHSYRYGDVYLTPVTNVVSRLTPEFQRDVILRYSALNSGKSEADIEAEWNRKRDVSLDKGTRVHHYIQSVLEGADLRVVIGVNKDLSELRQFDLAWDHLRAKYDAEFDIAEWMVGDAELGVGGRIDALLFLTVDSERKRSIFDWKTGKFTSRKHTYQMMLPPFDDLPACEHVKYSIQLSLYRLIIERNTDESFHTGHILHLPADADFELYECIDLRERLERWLLLLRERGELGDTALDKKALSLVKGLNKLKDSGLKRLSPLVLNKLEASCRSIVSN